MNICAYLTVFSAIYGDHHEDDGEEAIPDLNEEPPPAAAAADEHQADGHVPLGGFGGQEAVDLNFHAPEEYEGMQLGMISNIWFKIP